MLGTFSIPRNSDADVQTFIGTYAGAQTEWQTWRPRPGATMVHIFCLGGGGSGGAGKAGASGSAGGGGGGGTGAQIEIICPLVLLPPVLYFLIGTGAPGGNAAGNAGYPSYICIEPDQQSQHILAYALAGGGGNSTTTGGTGGTGAAIPTLANALAAGRGFMKGVAGQTGVSGSGTTTPFAVQLPTTGLLTIAGAGGGGVPASSSSAGGDVSYQATSSPLPLIPGGAGAASATVRPSNGSNGIVLYLPRFYYGGAGGGSSTVSATGAGLAGGTGGSGALGAGGGGGGGCFTGGVVGNGGPGGNGIAIITCW